MPQALSTPKKPTRRAAPKAEHPPAGTAAPARAPTTMPGSVPPALYALTQWAIRQTDSGWAIAPARGADGAKWSKPYRTREDAIGAIAAKLLAELTERHVRRCTFYRVPE